ncbi:uncharacterized protein BXZ73DRAFT_86835 [Epithele typhae]|uniref:uncharacterized protein n=1 Tax=Epithele typhae TaxID=378194 RepID=UPI002007BA89|nr:uncharacterized protein BXZ73DRAFT_86835 [Epithele typhae]KAH9945332.1 hypothetical protein BXZ73DRAFT_86835 [Epithele typhae]
MTATYPTEQEAVLVAAAEQLMVSTMARYDPSHDAYHVRRVRKTALYLARAVSPSLPQDKQPDMLVVELAALLHDVLDKKYVSAEQAADPYGYFRPYFEQWAAESGLALVADGRAELVARVVDNVSWTTEKKRLAAGGIGDWHRECVELHCVQDADRLDAIGAFGDVLHAPQDDPVHDQTAVAHFYDKLLHIREKLKTEPGKKMAEKRHQLMLDFLQGIDEEYESRV